MKDLIQKYFEKEVKKIEKVGEWDGVAIYIVGVEEDEEFFDETMQDEPTLQWYQVSVCGNRVVATMQVVFVDDGCEMFPDMRKTYLKHELEKILEEIEKRVSAKAKFHEKKQLIYDECISLTLFKDERRCQFEGRLSAKEKVLILSTTREDVCELLEELMKVIGRMRCG